MSFAIIIVFALALWLLAYGGKRRFGILGLSLSAGYLLSELWTNQLAALLRPYVENSIIAVDSIAGILIVLLPSLLLFVGGPTYTTKKARLLGSLLYTLLALVFCVRFLGSSLVLTGSTEVIYDMIIVYQPVIMTVALVFSIVDVLQVHGVSGRSKSAKH